MSRILAREAPTDMNAQCSSCVREGSWRCQDCLGQGSYCTECFRDRHRLLPFHKVEHWCGDHFSPAWLCQVGVVIHLGHAGNCCPYGTDSGDIPEADDDEDVLQSEESDSDWEDEERYETPVGDGCPLPDLKGQDVVLVIDPSGMHRIRIQPCCCPGAPTLEHQYLQMGFFPTSFIRMKTVVTFKTLEDQRLDNLECKTAVLKYWNKVRRKTSAYAWNSLPVSYSFVDLPGVPTYLSCVVESL